MARYVLTNEAECDIESIWEYTCKKWGPDQADLYLSKRDAGCEAIAGGKAVSRSFADIDPRLNCCHCEHHYVFFLETGDLPIIIAVLHERMDLMKRLVDRMD
ncbi:MAG: type II toxin-antitoxin system RelE/ParE family toxin [Alphaproteobacteria bacterium]|nr:type II toxin-antitoxin system RelE/ParE family toxin [Alphaproteobacteria bacterium]